MSDQEIKINLCYYDPENPNSNLDAYEDEDRPQPRNECGCDNCFYGRDKLAMQLIEAKRERDDAREKAERYRREANKFMLQRDEAKDKYATEATEHMLAVNKLCNERDEAQADCLEQARLLGMGSEREARLISQRDDALSQIAQAECRAERFCQERDDARIDAQKSKAYKRVLKETNLRQTERIRYLEGATNHACGTPLSVALRERDEARDALMKIEDLFIDGTDIYADRENMGLIARSALEETK